MKKCVLFSLLGAAAVMLALPAACMYLARPDAGMLLCMLLFFAVNPVFSVILGVCAGRYGTRLWYLPLGAAVLYLLGAWGFFSFGEPVFLVYAGVYWLLGTAALLLTARLMRRQAKTPPEEKESGL